MASPPFLAFVAGTGPVRGCPSGPYPSGALRHACKRQRRKRSDSAIQHGCFVDAEPTWIRFLPSAFWTNGCSLVVVNVYTSPVSETTSNSTCVPVRMDSSYA
jgi:hypothetical protein